jgi:plasmid stabilization system protein ParE
MIIVEVAEFFGVSLDAIEAFMLAQDEDSAARRSDKLESEIVELIERLGQYPKIGRRADFYSVTSEASQAWLEQVGQLAAQAGLQEFRECVLSSFLVLYACSEMRVMLLSIRHEREAKYGPDAE